MHRKDASIPGNNTSLAPLKVTPPKAVPPLLMGSSSTRAWYKQEIHYFLQEKANYLEIICFKPDSVSSNTCFHGSRGRSGQPVAANHCYFTAPESEETNGSLKIKQNLNLKKTLLRVDRWYLVLQWCFWGLGSNHIPAEQSQALACSQREWSMCWIKWLLFFCWSHRYSDCLSPENGSTAHKRSYINGL